MPSTVTLSNDYPFLRKINIEKINTHNYDRQENNNNIEFIPKIISSSYLNKNLNFIRKSIANILHIIDIIYLFLITVAEKRRLISLKSKDLKKILDDYKDKVYENKWDSRFNKIKKVNFKNDLNYFKGDFHDKDKEYHIYYCSSPRESVNYFPDLDEFKIIKCLAKRLSNIKDNYLILRLHPGYEDDYSIDQLKVLSKLNALIWDKRKCKNFKLRSYNNITTYTTFGSIFFESLGKEPVCLITSKALENCRNFLNQDFPMNTKELKNYKKNWLENSQKLKDNILNSTFKNDYFNPTCNYSKENIEKILFLINSKNF